MPYLIVAGGYKDLIDQYKAKGGLVFTRENIDPFICGNHANRCGMKVSEIYRNAGVPIEANGNNCTTITQCNDPTWGA